MEDNPKPMRRIMKTAPCEWCQKPAFHKYSAGPEYIRYACDKHTTKTERLCRLDGHKAIDYAVSSQPLKFECYES